MTSQASELQQPDGLARGMPFAVAAVSAALIAYEILLMQRMLIERWHHFGYLVISAALLGFGASGPLLALVSRRVRAPRSSALPVLAVTLALALLLMPRLASLFPVAARFIPGDLWRQVGWWSLYWLTVSLPFLVGAMFVGAALMRAGASVGRVYAANLFGSAAGAAGAALVVSRLAVEHTLWAPLALALAAVLILTRIGRAQRVARRSATGWITLVLVGLAIALGICWPLDPVYDEHKYAARLEQWEAQGIAHRIAAQADPHGYVELYASDLFHDLPFAALRTTPPPMYSLVVNGDPVGSVLRIDEVAEAGVMDHTLMAFPYRLLAARPRVALLGETGGANVWLARRHDARRIDVVQPNGAIIDTVQASSPALTDHPSVRIRRQHPRSFLRDAGPATYDLIQIVSLEGLAPGGTAVRGLAEDHLVTVEGLADCLCALRSNGILAVSRGIQYPPRENVRLFATLVAALESTGVADASEHIIQVRDYLGVCTMASRTPLTVARRDALRTAIYEAGLTPIWYAGIRPEDVNQPDVLSGPPGTSVDWLHHAAKEILSPRREQFYDAWLMNIRPPHDDSPFFWDFYRARAITSLKEAFGDLWLTRAEVGRLFLYASLLITAIAAILLILLPLGLLETRRWLIDMRSHTGASRAASRRANPRAVLASIVYFGGIGVGFMAIEMSLISRAMRWLGDPVLASATVIGGILVISGFGSYTGKRITGEKVWLAPAIVAIAATILRVSGWETFEGATFGPWVLAVVAVPTAYVMGIPMPTGISVLDRHRASLVPWAWGTNGAASVIATSVSIAVAMAFGYRTVILLAVVSYALAALAGATLFPHPRSADGDWHSPAAGTTT